MTFPLRSRTPAVRLARMPTARAVFVVLAFALGISAGRADDRVIEYGGDALTVRLVKAPLTEVLAELGRQAGAEIRGELRTPGDVTASFEAVPLPEALHRLLGDQNFALVYANGGKLRAIKLLGGSQTAVVPPEQQWPPPVPPSPPAAQDLSSLVGRHGAVPVNGHLAEVVGGQAASLQQLFEVALKTDDRTARTEAMSAAMSTVEADPTLRAALIAQLNGMDDAALSGLLRGAAGAHAEEVAMQLMTQSRASEIRLKASSVLQRLRAGS